MRKFRHDISIIPPKDVRFSGKSLSEYELILALIEKVNELIKYTNSVAELVYALEKWINDEFINAIDESTKKTLIEWRESGYLQELVEDYLVNLTVATSELLDEDEQNFKSGWHPVLDTKLSVDKAPEEVFDESYSQNLLFESKSFSNDKWDYYPTSGEIKPIPGDVGIEIVSTEEVNNRFPGVQQDMHNIPPGDYVFSIYIKTSQPELNDRGAFARFYFRNNNEENIELLDIDFDDHFVEDEWVRVVSKITVPNSEELSYVRLRINFRRNGQMYIKLPKLEKGDKVTDWTPNWQDLTEEEKPYTVMTLEKGISDDLFLISKIQESNLQKHDSMVRLRNVGQPFIIKDGVSGKYVEVSKSKPLDPNVEGIPFNEYNLRNVFANITFSLHPDNTDGKIMVALDKSSIMHKVNLDEGFLWLISRMDKLEDDMVIFEQWVREFVTTKITELENKVSKQIDDTVEYVDTEIIKNKNYVDQEVTKNKNYVDQEVTKNKNYVDQEVTETKGYVDNKIDTLDKKKKDKVKNERINKFMTHNGSVFSFMHRGWSAGYPENSRLSFQKAGDLGAIGVELDVRVTKDNRFIVIHDATVDRTTNGTGTVSEMTLSELKNLKLSGSTNYAGVPISDWIDEYVRYEQQGSAGENKDDLQKLLTIEEALDIVQGYNMKVLIETKGTWSSENLRKLGEILVNRGMLDQSVVFSFEYDHITTIRSHHPELLVGLVTNTLTNSVVEKADEIGECLISFNYKNADISINNPIIKNAKNLSIPMTTYTVNNRNDAFDIMRLGVGITSDAYPKLKPSPYNMVANFRYYGDSGNLELHYQYGTDVFILEKVDSTTLKVRLPLSSYDRFICRPMMSATGGDKYRIHAFGEDRKSASIRFFEHGSSTPVNLSDIKLIWFSIENLMKI